MDHVGTGELADQPDLAIEAADHFRLRQQFLADDLQGDDAVQFAVTSLEHGPHTALPEPFEQDVGTQQELLALFLRELIDLVRRQPAAFQEFLRQVSGAGKTSKQVLGQLIELGAVQELMLADGMHKAIGRSDRHAEIRAKPCWSGMLIR